MAVPTATSVRTVPAKLLEVNRAVINNQLSRTTGGKVELHPPDRLRRRAGPEAVPSMNAAFVADADGKGTPGVVRHGHVGLGLAVDVEKSDGSRTLLVPCIAAADTARLPGLRGRLRGPGAQGPQRQDLARRLRRDHRDADQPGHARHGAVGAPAHARPGGHRRRRGPRVPGRVRGGRRPHPGRPRGSARPSRSRRPTTTGSSRGPSPGSSWPTWPSA